ncbi:DUF350 domain-containing protein [Ectothiorhodospiraceae bacterium BW-2]|nr:DUF350 domain-containing protein [Ectothiorhodospiraceae bacterium BW-2]
MEQLSQFYLLSSGSLSFYLLDLALLIAFLAILTRFLGSVITRMKLTEVLSHDDNAAAGVAMSGAMVAIAVMLMGVASGDVGRTIVAEITLIVSYAILGVVIMLLTRHLFERFNMSDISIQQGIAKGNMAAAIVDAGNMLSTALIVRAVMTWVDGASWFGLIGVLVGFVVSQLVLYLATLYRYYIFNRAHAQDGKTLHGEIESGNCALALRFSGYRIGVGLAMTATSGVVVYDPYLLTLSLTAWVGLGLFFFVAQTVVSMGVRQLVLRGIDVATEVGEQRNVAIGAMEGAIYIAVGLVFMGLFV